MSSQGAKSNGSNLFHPERTDRLSQCLARVRQLGWGNLDRERCLRPRIIISMKSCQDALQAMEVAMDYKLLKTATEGSVQVKDLPGGLAEKAVDVLHLLVFPLEKLGQFCDVRTARRRFRLISKSLALRRKPKCLLKAQSGNSPSPGNSLRQLARLAAAGQRASSPVRFRQSRTAATLGFDPLAWLRKVPYPRPRPVR